MRISADRTGKDLTGEFQAKLRSEKNFLRKLRCRAVRTALHLFLCVLSCGIRKQPAHRLGGFGLRFSLAIKMAVVMCTPMIIWQILAFFLPALRPNERKWVVPTVLASTVLFFPVSYTHLRAHET